MLQKVGVDSPRSMSSLCLRVRAKTHTVTLGCICCCLGGMEQQGDLREGQPSCFGSDAPSWCGSSLSSHSDI